MGREMGGRIADGGRKTERGREGRGRGWVSGGFVVRIKQERQDARSQTVDSDLKAWSGIGEDMEATRWARAGLYELKELPDLTNFSTALAKDDAF